MSEPVPSAPRLRWWERRGPSLGVFVLLVAVMALASFALWRQVADVLPEVGQDRQGADPWVDPVGIEKIGDFRVARIPDCAAAPVVHIELWDEDSEPYWEVSGPAKPMGSFAIGVTPEGWETRTGYRDPPPDATLRLVVVRRGQGPAGVRYQESDLREGFVAAGNPILRWSLERFLAADVCGPDLDDDADEVDLGVSGRPTIVEGDVDVDVDAGAGG
jgi:hypothetical protein